MIAALHIGSASFIEIVWTLSGIVGTYFTWHNLRDSYRYVEAIRRMDGKNLLLAQELKIIAFGHYRNEVLRMVLFGIIITVGIAAMATPPAVPASPVTPVSVAITLGLLGITGILVAASFLDRRQRDLQLELKETEEAKTAKRTRPS